MNRVLKVVATILIGVFVLLLLAVVAVGILSRRPFPQTDGTLELSGLKEEVHVYRDATGIPHIYANNMEDLFMAQGYIHAQDRFWQMEWWRHIGQGRLSEMAGAGTIDSDKFIRTMGWNRIAAETTDYYERELPEAYKIMSDYAAGVNAYIGDKEPGDLSLNYTILQAVNEPWEIEPWQPLDTVAWSVVMSFDLANDIDREIRYAELIDKLGEETTFQLRPPYAYDTRPVIAATDHLVSDLARVLPAGMDTAVDWDKVNTNLVGVAPPVIGGFDAVGSNNWVLGGDLTDTGLPLLANDPHLSIQLPAIWYEIGLHAPGFDVVGFSFAGAPGVIIGHNDNIAWGVTNTAADVLDLYIERIEGDQYEFMGEMHDLELIDEVIKVNGGEDIVQTVRVTRHGPVISDVREDVEDVLAVRWAAQEPTRILHSVLLMSQAENYDEFREAARFWDVPSQNIVYADTAGNIAYQMPGLVPIRQNGFGAVPAPGWTGEYEWVGWLDYEALPALLNPETGYIVTANNAIVDRDYPFYINRDWSDGDRAQRIVDMLESKLAAGEKVTAADIAQIQFDSHSLLAETYVPLLANLTPDDPGVQEAINLLRTWDGQLRRDESAASVFEVFMAELPYALLADELGEENVELVRNNIFLHQIAFDPSSPWWDNVNTPELETREDIVQQALTEAIAWLNDNVSSNPGNWDWGSLHTATFVSSPVGQSGTGVIEALVNRGPFPADGGRSIVNATSYSTENLAAIAGHPSMRMIVDMSDLDATQTVLPTGQSGHPGHRHYDDGIEPWLNGGYHPLWWTRAAVEANTVDHLVLQP